MTPGDVDYVKRLLESGVIQSPCLELGAALEGTNLGSIVKDSGIEYYASDLQSGVGVDFVVDLDQPLDALLRIFGGAAPFGTILCMNVLEHTYAPLNIMIRVMELVREDGNAVFLTPSIWQLHQYPIDCWRINPELYVEFCRRNGFRLDERHFEYVGYGTVKECTDARPGYGYPRPGRGKVHYWWSRLTQRVLNTYGRGMLFPSQVATAAVIWKK